MGDIAHEKVSDDQRDTIFGVMCAASWHTFIILTKRPKALLRWYNDTDILGEGDFYPNVWIGVSISTQEDADQLIPFLLQIPAAVRIVSVEPMLGEINLRGGTYDLDWLNGWCVETEGEYDRRDGYFYRVPIQAQTEKIDGVIIGCESGPKRRPCKIERIENLIGQCVDTGTPVFVKQAEIDGKVVSMPRIMDRTWDQLPNQASPNHPG
uniref:Uncharacterized protein n=1 Tax=viral metagenome TaxID=1070528 RepID=A0A6M3K9E5_9ZZZZ